MRQYQRARVLRVVRSFLPAILALVASGGALAQTPLAGTVHTVTPLGQPQAVERNFTVKNAGSVSVTLTDFGSKLTSPLTPAPLAYVAMAVTQGSSVVGTPVTAPGTPITFDAMSNTTYTIHVVGLPGPNLGSGPIAEDVTDSKGNNIFHSTDLLFVPPQQSNQVGLLAQSLPAQGGGSFTLALTDLQFPAALQGAAVLLIDTTAGTAVEQPNVGSTSVMLNANDSYVVIEYGVEGSGQSGGLFGVALTPTAGGAAIYTALVPVGAVTLLQTSVSGQAQSSFTLGSSQATLQLTDLSFPTVPLSVVGAAVVDATTQTLAAPAVTGTGAQNISAPSTTDSYQVYSYGVADSTTNEGSYSVAVQQGTSFPFFEAQAVSSSSALQAFSFDTSVPSAGSYVLTLTDFKFPVQLMSDALAAVQNGQPLTSLNAAGKVSASFSKGLVTLLAFGSEGGQPASPGLMGVDLSPSGGGAAVFDVTEGIGTGFSSTTFTTQSAQAVQANVADLKFPAALGSLNLAVTSGTTLVGSISSAGSSGNFPFTTTANATYNVNVLAQPATPASAQQEPAGTYAMSVDPAPTATLTASSMSVASGGTVNLTWSSQNATSCTASATPSNSGWSGSENPSGGPAATAAITADTTFSLACTGGGGTANASVTVNVTAAPSGSGGHGGGGALDLGSLLALAALVALRWRDSRALRSR